MKSLTNLIGFQIVWFVAVTGAGRGWWWPGVVAMLVFAAVHWLGRPTVRGDGLLALIALVTGGVIDSLLAQRGLVTYAAPFPDPAWAPVWILALWVAFALTLNHSLRWLSRRPRLAALIGALAGPLSYWSAGRAFDAAKLSEPLWHSVAMLGIGWAFAMGLLSLIAARQRVVELPVAGDAR